MYYYKYKHRWLTDEYKCVLTGEHVKAAGLPGLSRQEELPHTVQEIIDLNFDGAVPVIPVNEMLVKYSDGEAFYRCRADQATSGPILIRHTLVDTEYWSDTSKLIPIDPREMPLHLAYQMMHKHPNMRPERVLTSEYEDHVEDFEDLSGCCCHTGCAPCSYCTHLGNPSNLEDEYSDAYEWDQQERLHGDTGIKLNAKMYYNCDDATLIDTSVIGWEATCVGFAKRGPLGSATEKEESMPDKTHSKEDMIKVFEDRRQKRATISKGVQCGLLGRTSRMIVVDETGEMPDVDPYMGYERPPGVLAGEEYDKARFLAKQKRFAQACGGHPIPLADFVEKHRIKDPDPFDMGGLY